MQDRVVGLVKAFEPVGPDSFVLQVWNMRSMNVFPSPLPSGKAVDQAISSEGDTSFDRQRRAYDQPRRPRSWVAITAVK